ncbi:MAG: hypothetical protein LBR79_02675 [Oscillospiraceae bacterium]|nr:hypothetical protein [Oscillospiraceae bacterium]
MTFLFFLPRVGREKNINITTMDETNAKATIFGLIHIVIVTIAVICEKSKFVCTVSPRRRRGEGDKKLDIFQRH